MSPTFYKPRLQMTVDRPPIRNAATGDFVAYNAGPTGTLTIHGDWKFIERLYKAMHDELLAIRKEMA